MTTFVHEPIEALGEVAAVIPAAPDGLSIAAIPDEVLILVLEAHPSRCEVRAVARRCRDIVEGNFAIRKVEPPAGQAFCVDLEINGNMKKHLYCANFGGNSAGEEGGVAGAVTFANWMPAYYRKPPPATASREVRHRIGDEDAVALWKTLVKVRDQRAAEKSSVFASNMGVGLEPETGYLTITEGCGISAHGSVESKREVIGKLSAMETALVLQVLDYRRNTAAWRLNALVA